MQAGGMEPISSRSSNVLGGDVGENMYDYPKVMAEQGSDAGQKKHGMMMPILVPDTVEHFNKVTYEVLAHTVLGSEWMSIMTSFGTSGQGSGGSSD